MITDEDLEWLREVVKSQISKLPLYPLSGPATDSLRSFTTLISRCIGYVLLNYERVRLGHQVSTLTSPLGRFRRDPVPLISAAALGYPFHYQPQSAAVSCCLRSGQEDATQLAFDRRLGHEYLPANPVGASYSGASG